MYENLLNLSEILSVGKSYILPKAFKYSYIWKKLEKGRSYVENFNNKFIENIIRI